MSELMGEARMRYTPPEQREREIREQYTEKIKWWVAGGAVIGIVIGFFVGRVL